MTAMESLGGSGDDTPAPKLTRRGHLRKWDRPPQRRDWRWYVGSLGKILIAVGLLMFGFVGYQLYGTGIQTAAAQNALENDFEELLAAVEPVAPTTEPAADAVPTTDPAADAVPTTDPEPPVVPVENQNLIAIENGDALARIEIPAIGVDNIVVAGVTKGDLQKGPGHFPETPIPGQLGNSAIAGHRTTYGQPFRNVDRLVEGDEIRMTTLDGVFVYRVTGQEIVSPSQYEVVATTDPTVARLTLTSCHPVFSARERIVIFSELAVDESDPVGEPVLNYGRPDEPDNESDVDDDAAVIDTVVESTLPQTTPDRDADELATDQTEDTSTDSTPGADGSTDGQVNGTSVDDSASDFDELGTDTVNEGIADAFSDGWFSDPGANWQVGLWGLAVSAVALGAYLLSRTFKRDYVGLLVGIVPFTVALYFFFQNVNRLLPPNL